MPTKKKPELEVFIAEYEDKGKRQYKVNLWGQGVAFGEAKDLPCKVDALVAYVKSVEEQYQSTHDVRCYPCIKEVIPFWDKYLGREPKQEAKP